MSALTFDEPSGFPKARESTPAALQESNAAAGFSDTSVPYPNHHFYLRSQEALTMEGRAKAIPIPKAKCEAAGKAKAKAKVKAKAKAEPAAPKEKAAPKRAGK